MDIRELIEERERQFLSPHAQFSADSSGRARPEEPSPLRTAFQRDRDRIIHSKSFRRLKHKTQVFLAPEGDHYRTRLTHTLEVAQVARTVSRALRLNEDLTEAIALGHDLGHTPFGHTGEDALTPPVVAVPFEHNEQSIRVVEMLERGGQGLNLTREVIDGILNHVEERMPATLEGRVVRLADRVAYINHDIDDAVRAGILTEGDLPAGPIEVLGDTGGKRINTLVMDMVEESLEADDVKMSLPVFGAMEELKDFLYDNVYVGSEAKSEQDKAITLLRSLYTYYRDHPEQLPAELPGRRDEVNVRVIDYIAGMTDRFALKEYERLFMPKVWEG